jgi:UDP-N-acetyl-2-amino-2-deoxyglucuronate dehydrogenase
MKRTQNKYNVGIIGYGWVATAHIDAINKSSNARVSAVYSSRELDAAALSAEWGSEIKTYTDLDEMLRDEEMQIVSVCSYPYQHKTHAIKAAQAGKHLIIEKPLALSWEECKEIEAVVTETGIKTCVCFECRFSNQLQVTKSVIDEGLVGDLHYGEIDYYHGIGPWYGQYRWNIKKEAGGSSLLSAGCHALDALLLCMNDEVIEVTSYESKSKNEDFSKYEYNSSSVTILKFKNGAIGKCASSIDCLQPYYFHTHLLGSEGSILDNKFHSTKLYTDKNSWSNLSMKMLDSGDVSDHPYQSQFQTFFDAVSNGVDMPLTSLHEAMKTFKVIFAADKSAAENNSVNL